MAFAFNPAGEQQLSLFDFYNSLTDREKKFLDRSWAKYFAEYISQRLMRPHMLFFTAVRIRVPILLRTYS